MILTLIYGPKRKIKGTLVYEPMKFEMYGADEDVKKDSPDAVEVLLIYLKEEGRMENLVLMAGDEVYLTSGDTGKTVNRWNI